MYSVRFPCNDYRVSWLRPFIALKADHAIFRIDKQKCSCVIDGLKPKQRRLVACRRISPVDSHPRSNPQGEGLFISQEQVPLTVLIAMDPDIGLVKRHMDAVYSSITNVWECSSLGLVTENQLFLRQEELQCTPSVKKSGKGDCAVRKFVSFKSRLRDAHPDENLVRRRSSPHLAPHD